MKKYSLRNTLLEKKMNPKAEVTRAWNDLNGNRFGCKLWEYLIGEHFAKTGTDITVQGNQENKTVSVTFDRSDANPATARSQDPSGTPPRTSAASVVLPDGRNPPPMRMMPFVGGDLNNYVEMMRFALGSHSFPTDMYGDQAIYFEADSAHTDICIMRGGKLQAQIHAKWNVGAQTRTIGTTNVRGGIPEGDQGMQNIIDPSALSDYLDAMSFDDKEYDTSITQKLGLGPRSGAQARKQRVGNNRTPFEMTNFSDILDHYLEILNSDQGKNDFAAYYAARFDDTNLAPTYFIYGSVPTAATLQKEIQSGERASQEYIDDLLNKVDIHFQRVEGTEIAKLIKESSFAQSTAKSIDMVHPQYGIIANFQIRARESSSATGRPPQDQSGVATRGLSNARRLSNDPNASYDQLDDAASELMTAIEVASDDKAKGEMFAMLQAIQQKMMKLENKKYSITARLLGK